MNFKHNFHTLSHPEKILYLLFIRPFWSRDRRFFFEGSLMLMGQMYVAERKALFDTIVSEKPGSCLEIGTYTGGGSTFFLAEAFYKLGKGKLITLESNERLFNKAKTYYEKHLPHLLPHVTFVHGDNFKSLEPFVGVDKNGEKKIDCFFLDGAENGQQTLDQYNQIMPFCKTGTILMAHDWNTEKTVLVKPIITSDSRWKMILELKPPESVGFVVFKRI